MDIKAANISDILKTSSGVFMAAMLSIDLLAFVGVISLVVVFRFRLRFRSNVNRI